MWSQLGPGSMWANTLLISCSGSSFSFNTATTETNTLIGNTQNWNHEGELSQGYFELNIWASSSTWIDFFEVDGLRYNTSIHLPDSEETLRIEHNISLPREIRLKAKTNQSSVILFSCLKFHGYFVPKSSSLTSSSSSTSSSLTSSSLTSSSLTTSLTTLSLSTSTTMMSSISSPTEESENNNLIEISFVVVFLLFFLGYWVIPISKPKEWKLNLHSIKHKKGRIIALTHYKGEYFDVVGYPYSNTDTYLSTFFGSEFMPFLGDYDSTYHVYSIGSRIPLSEAIQGAEFYTRLQWITTIAKALTKAHKCNQSLGKLEDLWIDPVSQRLSIANYYQHLDHPKGVDINRLGQIADELSPDCRDDEDWNEFIKCTLSSECPSAKECFKILSHFIALQ